MRGGSRRVHGVPCLPRGRGRGDHRRRRRELKASGGQIQADSRALLGGDLTVDIANRPLPPDELTALLPPGSRVLEVARTNAMVEAAADRHVAVALKAVEPGYPIAGTVQLDPRHATRPGVGDQAVIVAEPALLSRLRVHVGDKLRIGDAEVELRAVLVSEPDRLGGFISFGPRVMVSQATLGCGRHPAARRAGRIFLPRRPATGPRRADIDRRARSGQAPSRCGMAGAQHGGRPAAGRPASPTASRPI